ncbi:MAG: alpha/beta-hydrolase family protein, partial [Actinobacteria bacterium]|nr:alpha/beta-hydrolase family protein [Actinomycetota bacterium]
MTLSADDITAVMGEPAIDPVRVVGGYETSDDIAERARLTLQDMDQCGAFDRGLICVGSPTGVGYFNYSIAEALEYLTRGDCAIVVHQYALVPSALALTKTSEAEELTRLVLDGIRHRLATIPAHDRPRVVLVGESLGANVALDLTTRPDGHTHVPEFNVLGVSGGLYLGVPFRTRLWNEWRHDAYAVDPHGQLELVSQPDEASPLTAGRMRHLMIVHHDDPVNKYGFRMVLQPPWWMGPPTSRPPLVPRETKFRPITTFVLATVDLFNGMQSKPGTFVRRGHDYRIDIVEGLKQSFGLTSSPEQAEAVELALRSRESEWAARRMVARKLDKARRSIERQLAEWGAPTI